MRNRNIITALIAAALFCGQGLSLSAKSDKRGVSENNFLLMNEILPLAPGVSWFYNWGNNITGYKSEITNYLAENPILEFCPMCWNGNYDSEKIRTWCKAHPETKYLLGFNEPNFTDQANMTPAEAAEAWPAVQALAKELNLKLVGPAVNYAPSGEYTNPFKWYAEFVALVGTDAFDYVAVHDYAGGTANMKDLVERFYELYGKPLWITEFCSWSGTVSADAQVASMIQQLEYLEKEDRVFRYAWFKAKASNLTDTPHYSLLVPVNGTGLRELTQQGYVYTYMTDFDESRYHATGNWIPAGEFIHSSGIRLDKTADAESTGVIEISQFNSGACVDYQFDVPADGNYKLTLRVSGQGEPVRFDPSLGICAVNADDTEGAVLAEAQTFTLSGDDAVYADVTFALSLKAGKQKLRLKDTKPYSPSGIRISQVKLTDASTGIHDALASQGQFRPVLRGGMLQTEGLADVTRVAVYDVNGRSVLRPSASSAPLCVEWLPVGTYIVRVQTADGSIHNAKFIINK